MSESTVSQSQTQTKTLEDAVNGITALQLAVDTLGRIAEFGGVQGEWSVQALKRINEILIDRPALRLADPLDAATGQGRR